MKKIVQHGKYKWLPMLYNIVTNIKPSIIVEFGPGKGYTTTMMALALKDHNINGTISSYDIWNDSYWGNYDTCKKMFQEWNVSKYITLQKYDFYDWIKLPKHKRNFDLLYFDIDNDGQKILDLYLATNHNIDSGSVVIFEGGSSQRDNVSWMSDKRKINDIKDDTGYVVLTDNTKYSVSMIYNSKKYNKTTLLKE